jgi:lipoprotein-anchoring transpeptidase ErfK/SrfK
VQTIKTGVVVALLLAVCYGAFVALNSPEPELPDELLSEFDWNPDEAGLDGLMNVEMPGAPSSAAMDVQLPTASFSPPNLPAVGGIGTSDLANLSMPSLPALGSSAAPNAAGDLAPPPSAPSVTAPTPAGLPAFPGGTFNASDGPAVSLPTTPLASTTGTANATVSPSQADAIGPTHNVSTALSPDVQLPLLNTPEASKNAQAKQPPTTPFATAREQALALAESGKLRDALQMLSGYYNSPELNSAQHADLVDLLDALSREVIYSPRHLAESPYTVTAQDTVESLAAKYQITPELLGAINRLGDSKALVDGTQVKVLTGPFRAEVSLSRQELTLFMGDLYAGRFPVSFGNEPSPVEGTFEIIDRRRDRNYFGTGGKVLIPAEDPRNPYGGYWLRLGQDLCIHGTAEMASDEMADAGCISLAPLDAADVYNILAQSNQVNIVR